MSKEQPPPLLLQADENSTPEHLTTNSPRKPPKSPPHISVPNSDTGDDGFSPEDTIFSPGVDTPGHKLDVVINKVVRPRTYSSSALKFAPSQSVLFVPQIEYEPPVKKTGCFGGCFKPSRSSSYVKKND